MTATHKSPPRQKRVALGTCWGIFRQAFRPEREIASFYFRKGYRLRRLRVAASGFLCWAVGHQWEWTTASEGAERAYLYRCPRCGDVTDGVDGPVLKDFAR